MATTTTISHRIAQLCGNLETMTHVSPDNTNVKAAYTLLRDLSEMCKASPASTLPRNTLFNRAALQQTVLGDTRPANEETRHSTSFQR